MYEYIKSNPHLSAMVLKKLVLLIVYYPFNEHNLYIYIYIYIYILLLLLLLFNQQTCGLHNQV